jgi:hypothetical protein
MKRAIPSTSSTIERDGEPWFLAADICASLCLDNVAQALQHLEEDEKDIISTDTPGGLQNMLAVSESGMYSLVMASRKPAAKRFKKWVLSEVVPSIRELAAKKAGLGSVRTDSIPQNGGAVGIRPTKARQPRNIWEKYKGRQAPKCKETPHFSPIFAVSPIEPIPAPGTTKIPSLAAIFGRILAALW